jgi:hypothetical protein
MGFLDRAKDVAAQAQAKLDEVQGQFNERQKGETPAAPGPGFDAHGRPKPAEPATDAPEPSAPSGPEAADPPAGKPGAPKAAPGSGSGLSSGDPLAG